MPEPIVATYRIETPNSLESVAEMIAGEQSCGTFVAVPGETEDLRRRHRAQVLSIDELPSVELPSLGGCRAKSDASSVFRRAEVRIAFPLDNVGLNLPTVLATVGGNLYELAEHSGCKLLDIELPVQFAERYAGPQFGIDGTRDLCNVHDRPILGTIIKPSVGLSPEQTAALVRELGEAGIDFIKDDELMANPPHSPIQRRIECVMREVNDLADKLGRKVMYAFNISDELDAMRRHHDLVVKHGGTCVMLSINHVGCAAVSDFRKHCSLPIHGHRNGWGMLNRHPLLGIDFKAYQTIWRTIGVDQLHVNGIANKFWESDDSVVSSVTAMQQPLWGGHFAMPVISSGQWGGQAPETYRRIQSVDLMYMAGGGIMAHPSGMRGGVLAIQQAWEAATTGVPLVEHAKRNPELRQSLEKFGGMK